MKKVPAVFLRRFDSHKFEKIMRRGAVSVFFDTKNRESFKQELAKASIDAFLFVLYKIDIADFEPEIIDSMVDYIINIFNPLMDMYYKNFKRDYPMG